jgi:hypothetical protein
MAPAVFSSGIPIPLRSYVSQEIGPQAATNANSSHSGVIMNGHSQGGGKNRYSPVLCILLLLITGVAVKTSAAIRHCQLAQDSCQLALR